MNIDQAINHLTQLVERIPELEKLRSGSEEFTQWRREAQTALRQLFKSSPEYAEDFGKIRYSLMIAGTNTPDSDFQEAYIKGLRTARAFLQANIEEIKAFGLNAESTQTELSQPPIDPTIVFTIHGRQMIDEFHNFIRALGLKPLEWSQARAKVGKPNPYTWEVVDWALKNAGAIVVLMTPDDEAILKNELWGASDNALEKELMGQPRQNVLFEAGVAYGRNPDRTVLLRVGSHRPMSDLAGHHILQLNDSAESRQAVADALKAAGCPVDLSGSS